MASTVTENTPLLPTSSSPPPPSPSRAQPRVTFNPTTIDYPPRNASSSTQSRPLPITSPTFPTPGPPGHSSFNSKLRRRNSHGSPLSQPPMVPPASKIGPQRTTKNLQKLKLLPNPEIGDEGPDEESGRDIYSQFTRIKDPTARRDAERLGKADRDRLPRVTAYCTANSYRLEGLMKFLKGRGKTRGANPKQFDECIYSPFDYGRSKKRKSSTGSQEGDVIQGAGTLTTLRERRRSDSALEVDEQMQARREELISDIGEINGRAMEARAENEASEMSHTSAGDLMSPTDHRPVTTDFDTHVHTPEVFLFEYGTVVIWGMTLAQEQRFLKDIAKFETEKFGPDDVQTEDFNFYYTREYQARIYNDFISLREKRNYMTKLAISHALAQSVKTSLFEDLLSTTIADTTPLPALLATTGSISLGRREINKKIGELFILRINIHLQGSVLDSPELMWAEPQLEPIYSAVRSYLEMDQRVELMTERLGVLGDLLAVLKDQVGTRHGEVLEWIVIVLIAAEILVAAINIVVDLYAGVD